MKKIELIKVGAVPKIGAKCGPKTPNVTEDAILCESGVPIGFYLRNLAEHSPRMAKLADVANAELRSERVPKSVMNRKKRLKDGTELNIEQYSTIIGSCPPKPHMRRPYPARSSVHAVKSADIFVTAMLALGAEGEILVQKYLPEQYEKQLAIIEEKVPPKWRFGKLFTSSISNFNISAAFHRDAANLEGCVNIIISKKWHANGGHLYVPEFDATFDCTDNSMIVYPAWKSVHGVTPIETEDPGGFRNSLVFYPLKAFTNFA